MNYKYEPLGEEEIVDRIKIERYNPEEIAKKQSKNTIRDEIDAEPQEETIQDEIEYTESQEETMQDDIEYTETQEEIMQNDIDVDPQEETMQDDVEVKSEGNVTEEESYLDEITNLLSELEGLDVLLKATSVEIKDEKDKKQKNAKLRDKMKKIDDIMQE